MIRKKRDYRKFLFSLIFSIIVSIIVFVFKWEIFTSLIWLVVSFIASVLFYYFKEKLATSARVKKIEQAFPDFLQLMTSNLRAGMTIDRAMLLSSRPEFAPLDVEILKAGKDITTGKTVEASLFDMSKRIGSEKIDKVIMLIITGIKAGGNLSVLLEKTSVNMREKDFVEKKASSNVLMYVIFIFLAVAIFAPGLFALSNVLVSVMTKILSGVPNMAGTGVDLPFTMSQVSVSTNFITYFSLLFIVVMDVLASLVLGLVSKGEEKEGLKYMLPILVLSLTTFLLLKTFLSNYLAGLF